MVAVSLKKGSRRGRGGGGGGVGFFQAEDGIRDVERSRGLGDVYKRQLLHQFDYQRKKCITNVYFIICL